MMNNLQNRFLHYYNMVYYVIKGVRKPIIIKRRNLKKRPIRLYWWMAPNINNFGDTVSRDIIPNIFGNNVAWSPLEECELIAAGSILELTEAINRESKFYVWGSGFIKKDSPDNKLHYAVFKAVRGLKTKQRIKKKSIPTGDPGILAAPTYLLKKKRRSKTIGVVIHYADTETTIAKRIKQDPRFIIINPLDEPRIVAQKISECGLVLSSSLHGLIFADSLKIPNAHIKISDNVTGGTYKFIDYYSGVEKKYAPADIDKIFNNEYLNKLKKEYQPIPHLAKKQRTLIKAFPF